MAPAAATPGPAAGRGPVDPRARTDYDGGALTTEDEAAAPLALLERWYAAALDDPRVGEPAAMVVATVDPGGVPDARTVLLKGLDARGLVFYTNLTSAKARQLAARPAAAVVLPWHDMHRQVRLRGPVELVDRALAAAYFGTRPRGAQLGAWASRQSAPLAARAELDARVADLARRWPEGAAVPLPDHWGGYRVRPVEIELWVGRASRLHDRLVLTSASGAPAALDDGTAWTRSRRQP